MIRRPRVALAATIVLALTGLAVSVALAIDYLGPAPAYCAETGCATVRASSWAHPLGIPTPIIGAAFFAITLALIAVAPRSGARRAWSIGGGVIALGLIAVQGFVIGAWCKLCLIVDGATVALAALALATALPQVQRRGGALIAALAAAAIAGPIAIVAIEGAPAPLAPVVATTLPDVVAREQVAGELTIVEFVDFECPFCRALHGRLAAALRRASRPVRIVRKMVPLHAHAHAMPAAIAWCGADAQGRGDAMADALIAADPSELTPEGCERIAARIGLDLDSYRRTCAAPSTRARIEADTADARGAGVKMLPTVYVGATAFAGASATEDDLVAALRGA